MSRILGHTAQARKGRNALCICPPPVGIRVDVASHLDAERDAAKRVEASMRSRLQLARLTAAAYRDIGGNRLIDIADGRRLWVAVGAWPWWAIARATGRRDLSGGLPSGWWELQIVGQTLAPSYKAADDFVAIDAEFKREQVLPG